MNAYLTYGIIFVILLALELCYFKVADHFNIIDTPNERSSHSTIAVSYTHLSFALTGIRVMPRAALILALLTT